MPDALLGRCWHCGQGLSRADYGREERCPGCDRATHVCRNCRHYAPGRANECLEPLVERLVDKTRANFCELFTPTLTPLGADRPAANPDSLRQAAEDLFKL